MENNEVVQKCGPKFWQNLNFRGLLPNSPACLGYLDRQGCMEKPPHTFVQPHRSASDSTLASIDFTLVINIAV